MHIYKGKIKVTKTISQEEEQKELLSFWKNKELENSR